MISGDTLSLDKIFVEKGPATIALGGQVCQERPAMSNF